MSDETGKPPVDQRYQAALMAQTKCKAKTHKTVARNADQALRFFRFLAERDGLTIIYPASGITIEAATQIAIWQADNAGARYCGRLAPISRPIRN